MAALPRIETFAAAPDLAEAIAAWQSWLTAERRVSPHTAGAYLRDLKAFLDFLADGSGILIPSFVLPSTSAGLQPFIYFQF